jgi:thiol-disulfide isomerase/thioredoxin
MKLRLLNLCASLVLSPSLFAAEIGEKIPACEIMPAADAKSYAGKVLYIDFWASWCPPCAQSFPFMNELSHDLKDKGLQIVAINMDATLEDTQAFLGKYPANFTVMTDVDEHCAKNFAIKAMPSSFLIDRKGVIRSTHLGFRDDDAKAIRALIEQLLEETPTPQ